MSYYDKYLKYKEKYLSLKEKIDFQKGDLDYQKGDLDYQKGDLDYQKGGVDTPKSSYFTCDYSSFNPMEDIVYNHWLYNNYPSPDKLSTGNNSLGTRTSLICYILKNQEIKTKFLTFLGEEIYNKYLNLFIQRV